MSDDEIDTEAMKRAVLNGFIEALIERKVAERVEIIRDQVARHMGIDPEELAPSAPARMQ
jgi:hypothetical protein